MAVSGNFSETVGALTLSANSTIDFAGFVARSASVASAPGQAAPTSPSGTGAEPPNTELKSTITTLPAISSSPTTRPSLPTSPTLVSTATQPTASLEADSKSLASLAAAAKS
jgi:hypothetical protein